MGNGNLDLIRIYVSADSEKRVDLIIRNYPNFLGMVDGYTEGLCYMIENEKESNSRHESGALGVRIQGGNGMSDPTARKAIRNLMLFDALVNCDFSGDIMEGVDCAETYMEDAYVLRDMRKDYALFNSQLSILGTQQDFFTKYLRKEISLTDVAEDQGITYEAARQKIYKIRQRLKRQVISFMDRKIGGMP